MSAHTPGPWSLDVEAETAGGCRTILAAGESIGQTDGIYDDEEDLANARLIAAAPELLAAMAECAGMLSACIDIIAGRQRANGAAADNLGAMHRKCLALLVKATKP